MKDYMKYMIGAAVAVPVIAAGSVFAASTVSGTSTVPGIGTGFNRGSMRQMQKPAAEGTVTSVSGNTITIISKPWGKEASSTLSTSSGQAASPQETTYTIDATNAKITKGFGTSEQTLTASQIAVGDMIVVQGTASGTAITATTIVDGVMPMGPGKGGPGGGFGGMMRGLSGTVSAVNGSTFTVAMRAMGKPGTTATATPAVFTVTTSGTTTYSKNGVSDTASDLAVGQMVSIQGTVDKTAHTAAATKVAITIPVPHAMGTVSAINGSTLTIAGKARGKGSTTTTATTYTVDASNASITSGFGKTAETIPFSSIAVGESVNAEGAIGTDAAATTFTATKVSVFNGKK